MVTASNQMWYRGDRIFQVYIVAGDALHWNTRVFWLLFRVTLLMKGCLLQRLARRTAGSIAGWVRLDSAYLVWIQTCWIVWLGCGCRGQSCKQTNTSLSGLIALVRARWNLGNCMVRRSILLISLILLELGSHFGWIICCSCGVSVMLVQFGSNWKLAKNATSTACCKICRLLAVAPYFWLLCIPSLIRIVLYTLVE